MLALAAVRVVVAIAPCGFLDFRFVENDAQHAGLGLLKLALHPALRGLVLAAGTNHIEDTVGKRRKQISIRVKQAGWTVDEHEVGVFRQVGNDVLHPLGTDQLVGIRRGDPSGNE